MPRYEVCAKREVIIYDQIDAENEDEAWEQFIYFDDDGGLNDFWRDAVLEECTEVLSIEEVKDDG